VLKEMNDKADRAADEQVARSTRHNADMALRLSLTPSRQKSPNPAFRGRMVGTALNRRTHL
jgi:hypothetical protein